MGFPSGSVVKNLSTNVGDSGLISGLGRSPGEGNGNPHSMDRGAWWATWGHQRVGSDLVTEQQNKVLK